MGEHDDCVPRAEHEEQIRTTFEVAYDRYTPEIQALRSQLDEAVRLLWRLRAPETSHERDAIDAFLAGFDLTLREGHDAQD